jgi:hypothetical protein
MADEGGKALHQVLGTIMGGGAALLTAVAGFLGVLHETGYLGHEVAVVTAPAPAVAPAIAAPAVRLSPAGQQVATIPVQEPRAVAVAQPHPINLTGAWRGGPRDGCHLIKQKGHTFEVTTFFPGTEEVRTIGDGTLTGRRVQMRMNRQNPESVTLDMFLSDDGRELTGEIQGKQQSHVALWRRVGPTCR